jgi:hypothetical protein
MLKRILIMILILLLSIVYGTGLGSVVCGGGRIRIGSVLLMGHRLLLRWDLISLLLPTRQVNPNFLLRREHTVVQNERYLIVTKNTYQLSCGFRIID